MRAFNILAFNREEISKQGPLVELYDRSDHYAAVALGTRWNRGILPLPAPPPAQATHGRGDGGLQLSVWVIYRCPLHSPRYFHRWNHQS